jgi:multiple sugar transport system ATP-binding protein
MGRAIVRNPQVFLFDEPLSNLDAKLRVQMRAEIKDLHQRLKVTTVYVTHDQTEAMTMGDRLAALNQGRIQQVGRPHDIYERPANVFVAGFLGYPPMNVLRARVEADGIHAGPLHFSAPSESAEVAREESVTVGVRPEDIVVWPSTDRDDGGAAPGVVRLVEPA